MPYFEDNSISHDITTDAGFRAWGSMFAKGLKEVGLVQTADTGQINWETVETPGENNTDAGYEVWRFNDALQETQPIYLKIIYGRALSASRLRLAFQVGTGSDGAGNLEGKKGFGLRSISVNPAGNGLIYISLLDGALSLLECVSTGSTSQAASVAHFVERLKTPDLTSIYAICAGPSVAEGLNIKSEMRLFSTGEWFNHASTLGHTGSESAGGFIIPGILYPPVRVACAPLRTFTFIKSGIFGAGDTGIVEMHGKEIEYIRLSINATTTVADTNGSFSAHNLLAPHEA